MILEGITRHGKNRVREQGPKWNVIQMATGVQFSTEAGIWFLLQSATDPQHLRWVHEKHDPHFRIVQREAA